MFTFIIAKKKIVLILAVFVVCRRGNDSQKAVVLLKEKCASLPVTIKDVKGGLTAWTKHIDPDFPKY